MNKHTKRFKSPGIGAKTLLSHVLLCVLVILLAALLSYALTYRYIRETRQEDLLKKAEHIARSVRSLSEEDMPQRSAVRMYEHLTDSMIFFLDTDAEVIRLSQYEGDSEEVPPKKTLPGGHNDGFKPLRRFEVLDSIDREFARRVLDGESVSAIRRFEFAQSEIIFAGVPIRNEVGETNSGVVLVQPVAQLRRLSRAFLLLAIVVTGLSLLLSFLLATQMSRRLVRPIQRITQAARRMESGLYAERITRLPGDEIGELGHALNSMSGRLMDEIKNVRTERDKLELVISGIGEGLIAVDTDRHIVHANNAFLEIMETDDSSGLMDETQGDAGLACVRDMLTECMASGQKQSLEWENASHRAVRIEATALKDENGTILGAVGLLRDVSETQRLEQLRRDYVANISHELRTPLTGIRGMVEPLIDGCMETEEERLESYKVILKETIRLQKLVGEMLDMSRLQDGRVTIELEEMELPGILQAAIRNMKPVADEAGIDLRMETDGSRLVCMGNEGRIMQVLIILIDNALGFTPRGGSVVVFARDGADCVYAGVRDTGCGIEPKDMRFIWERFYKADRSRMRTTGTGLGLAIAKQVTQIMGGDIWAESEPGAGAEFTFSLKKSR